MAAQEIDDLLIRYFGEIFEIERDRMKGIRSSQALDFIRRELPGWPKDLPCLNCGCVRRSEDPGDRLCDTCRGRAADIDTGPPHHAPGLQ